MRIFFFTFILFFFFSQPSFTKPKSFAPQGLSAKFYKGDLIPRRGLKMTFEFMHCSLSSELLNIKKFEYVITSGSTPTRIINIYANRNDSGKKCGGKSVNVKQTYMINPDITRSTQFYLTTDSDVTLSGTDHF